MSISPQTGNVYNKFNCSGLFLMDGLGNLGVNNFDLAQVLGRIGNNNNGPSAASPNPNTAMPPMPSGMSMPVGMPSMSDGYQMGYMVLPAGGAMGNPLGGGLPSIGMGGNFFGGGMPLGGLSYILDMLLSKLMQYFEPYPMPPALPPYQPYPMPQPVFPPDDQYEPYPMPQPGDDQVTIQPYPLPIVEPPADIVSPGEIEFASDPLSDGFQPPDLDQGMNLLAQGDVTLPNSQPAGQSGGLGDLLEQAIPTIIGQQTGVSTPAPMPSGSVPVNNNVGSSTMLSGSSTPVTGGNTPDTVADGFEPTLENEGSNSALTGDDFLGAL